MEAARRQGRSFVVPAGVLAQVWRGGSRQARLARFLAARGVEVEALTAGGAKAAGLVCAQAAASDVVDASMVITARRHGATVVSSDRAHLEALDPGIAVVDC
jgi:predicted nucleic acid-binding protein